MLEIEDKKLHICCNLQPPATAIESITAVGSCRKKFQNIEKKFGSYSHALYNQFKCCYTENTHYSDMTYSDSDRVIILYSQFLSLPCCSLSVTE